jgi:CDP-glycerol glycerophosphotransferase (TagB/SpsB family)
MAKPGTAFTFAGGNAAALRRLPWYLLGSIATLLVPRTRRVWVFGCGIGPGEGALPLYRLARARQPETRMVWLAGSEHELAVARDLGLDAELKLTRRGLWLTLRAQVCVVTHGLGDVNRYGVRGAFVVQLWHGVPLKKLHLDSPAALHSALLGNSRLVRKLLARGIRAAGAQIRLFPVSSERIVGRISSAFGVPRARIAVTGDPRDDVLLTGPVHERRDAAKRRLTDALGQIPSPCARVVLYAPTWRDGQHDPSAPDEDTWDEIAAWAERTDTVLIVRVHPLGHGDYAAGPARSKRVRVCSAEAVADITPLLAALDALVTDYSSIAFDFALLDGPTVFLAPDLETYAAARGLYEPYRMFSGGQHVVTWAHALEQLDALADPDSRFAGAVAAHTRWLRQEHFDYLDGRAGERVLDEIARRTGGARWPVPGAATARPEITELAFEPGRLRLRITGHPPTVRAARLDGSRLRVDAPVAADGTVELPLLITRWGVPGLALPSGDYRLTLLGDPPSTRVAPDALGAQPAESRQPLYRASAFADDGGVAVRIGAPLGPGESPVHGRYPPSIGYVRRRDATAEKAVYLESFYGTSACDNPLAIDRVLARDHPQIRRYWSVQDGSTPVPDGAVRLIEGSGEWWRVRAQARVLIVNDWLRWYFRRGAHQHVLQTWHGTMLKKLALDRVDRSPRERFATVRQGRRWDALLAQNDYSAERFRTSYAYRGPIWTTGYPRNDILAGSAAADPGRADAVRAAVGLPPGARAVLYAPTWRDDRAAMVDHLDVTEFARSLPSDAVLLVRGHSRTLRFGQDARAERLIDVTSYPDVAELMTIADLLVTDYSSVMFDFAATGKPMIFYTPDIAHYGDVLRGFYFDLLADAPGPVVTSAADLRAAIADPAPSQYADKYAAWQAQFAPLDDGHAGERVVARLFESGWLD